MLLDPQQDLVQKVTLEYHFEGDLRCSQIDIFLEEDCIDDLDRIVDAWAISASWALMPTLVKVWSTHRWVSNIAPLCKTTLLDVAHKIRRYALRIYLAKQVEDKQKAGAPNAKLVDGQIVLSAHD